MKLDTCDSVSTQAVWFQYLLSIADSQLILGHRLSEWAGHGPMLEEDIALSNLGLDLLGQARSLYEYAAKVEGDGRDENQLAYFRDATAFRNVLLAEQPNGDFAQTMVRHFFYSTFFHGYWQAASDSIDNTFAAIAEKAVKEMSYHQRHSSEWVIRLGDGTQESHVRAQQAIDVLWSFTGELFESLDDDLPLVESATIPDPLQWQPQWRSVIEDVTTQATLTLPESDYVQTGGRAGQHTEHLGYLLAQMQHMQRTYPGLSW